MSDSVNTRGWNPLRAIAASLIAALALSVLAISPGQALSWVRDLASVEGLRKNQLVGYGIVVGLNNTGDTLTNIPFTRQSLQAMLERLGVNTKGPLSAQVRTQNLAAVMVTANLPPFAA